MSSRNRTPGAPDLEALLFSLAARRRSDATVAATIVTVTLAHGARRMAKPERVAKRLDAIEDIGAIDVLCTDKTGTLTNGTVTLDAAIDSHGSQSERVRRLALDQPTGQSGFKNPIDQAVASSPEPDGADSVRVLGEVPDDFTRRLLTLLVEDEGRPSSSPKGPSSPS